MTPLRTGATVGVLGSGQLGRMFTEAAHRLGYKVSVFSPEKNSPTGQIADTEWVGDYTDTEQLTAFANSIERCTLEFENIPIASLRTIEKFVPVRPNAAVLETTQNRWREKSFLRQNGFPVTPFCLVKSPDDFLPATQALGLPAILKTSTLGYDGRGQRRIESPNDWQAAFSDLGGVEMIAEKLIRFTAEMSVIGVRSAAGDFCSYPLIRNQHAHHILDISVAPSGAAEAVEKQAREIAMSLMEKLGVVGLLCIEFFLTEGNELLINELAPRPHNSGHLTIEGFATSQFEQQVRCLCDLPLGSPALLQPVAMANLMGEIWTGGEPLWDRVAGQPCSHLHLYGKASPRPGRKMGHLTVLGDSPAEAEARAISLRRSFMR